MLLRTNISGEINSFQTKVQKFQNNQWRCDRVPTVMESQGKSWKNLRSWKVMEKSWKITKISKVMENEKFYPNSHSKYSARYRIFQNYPVMNFSRKFLIIPTAEIVMENHSFYPNLHSKYSHGYGGFWNCPEMNFPWKITRILTAELVMENR